MGCGVISLLKLRGAYVVAIDIRRESLEDARRYGADEVYLTGEARKKFLPGCTGDYQPAGIFDVVMEWAETRQFLHVDDAAKGFVGALGKKNCIGQVFNLVNIGLWVSNQKKNYCDIQLYIVK